MTDQYFTVLKVLQRLHAGPLGKHIDDIATYLTEQGYARSTIKTKIRFTGVLNRWMQQRGLTVGELDEQTTDQFLQELRRKKGRIVRDDVPTLKRLLECLRHLGVISTPPPEVDDSELGRIEHDFSNYLERERRLSQTTIVYYLPVVRRFLEECFGTRPILLEEINQTDISRFVLSQARNISRGRAKLIVTALRSFFRFLLLRGNICADLAAVVPTVANWRFSGVPKWIPQEQVEHLLRSNNHCTPTGLRNYTILLLLARLGLRSAEIVKLTLDDIDWEAGEIRVGGKSRRQDRLPLPKDVGEALARYLRHGRPRCSTRRVFLRLRAPIRGLAHSSSICSIVRHAFDRAGIHPARKGAAYILRHSLATNMLRNGASLGEIGEILRHCNLNTTQIYAKVDLGALRKIALPWPGVEE